MRGDCVRITYEENHLSTVRLSVDMENQETICGLDNNGEPVVYLFSNSHLDVLRQHEGVLIDRKKKNAHKGLAEHFLKTIRGKIQIIATQYSTARKLYSGLRPLLNRAVQYPGTRTFFIGVDQEVFDTIRNEAQSPEAKNFPTSLPKDACTLASEPASEDRSHSLLQYLEKQHGISRDLEKKYIGNSQEVQITRMMILAASKVDVPVLITGDTGTGKEVVARQIHEHSSRKNNGFTAVNCGSIPRELLELELFGCEENTLQKGYPRKTGLWETAGKGTLFLDEIGDLSLDHQVKILRALEENTIRRVGGTKEIRVTARILAATNRNLFAMVQANSFREDLYYRLRGFIVRTTALRDHAGDIPLLARYFWKKITHDSEACLPDDILHELCKYSWPGNVRELKMVLTNLFSLFQTQNPTPDNLKDIFYLEGQTAATKESATVSVDEIKMHRAHCLRHLNRTYEVFHACSHKLKGSLSKQLQTEHSLTAIRQSLHFLRHEVEQLCAYPLYFHQKNVYSAIYDFMGKIDYLLSLLSRNKQEALDYLEADMVLSIEKILGLVFQEIEKVMEEG